jgi:hypothetical protein
MLRRDDLETLVLPEAFAVSGHHPTRRRLLLTKRQL